MTDARPAHRPGTAIIVTLAVAVLAVPAAYGAAPTRKRVPNTTTTLDAGHACPFKVLDRTLPRSRRTETTFPNGRHVISGPARERLTNAESGASIVVNSSGTVSYRKGADGRTRYRFTGANVLYFFPGDEGPIGKAGANGALYHVVGRAAETLATDDVVTSFTLRGRAAELCNRIS